MSNHSSLASTTESQALKLLVDGVPQAQVASCLGVSESLISQFLSQESFRTELVKQKYANLVKHNERDTSLDSLEDKLIRKIEQTLPMVFKPLEIAHLFRIINSAKRRGTSSQAPVSAQATVIQLTLPVQIIQHFQVNAQNQVIKAGSQELITVQSGRLPQLLENSKPVGETHVLNLPNRNESTSASSEVS